MSNSDNLTEGAVWRNLISLAVPMTIGIVAVLSVSIVDTYFVGQLGTKPLAALSFAFPVTLSINSMAIGLGAGAASVVSRVIGAGRREEASRVTTDSLLLGVLIVIAVCAVGFVTIRPLFAILGASGETLDLIVRYMRIWYASMPFLIIPMVANAILRSAGNAIWPSSIMVFSAVINVALTPALIFGWWGLPAFEIEGAAWATLIARVFTLGAALWVLIYLEDLIEFCMPTFHELLGAWKDIAKIAGPAALGNMVNPLGITVVTSIVAVYSDSVVAAFGVATRIESFASIPMLALSAAIGPMAGQNWGSQDKQRIVDSLKISYLVCCIWSALIAVFFYVFGAWIVAQFTDDRQVAEEATFYLTVVPLSLWGYGVTIVAAGAFNAFGKSVHGLSIYLLRTAVFYVPLSWVATLISGSQAVFIAISVANFLAGIAIVTFSFFWLRNTEIENQS